MSPGQADNRSGSPANVVAVAVFPHQTALDRLNDFRSHHSLLYDFRRNWAGWLFSLLFHGSLVVLASLLITEVVQQSPPLIDLTGYGGIPVVLSTEPIEDPLALENSYVDSEVDGAPSQWSDNKVGPDAQGVTNEIPGGPDYIGLGGNQTGIGKSGGIGIDRVVGHPAYKKHIHRINDSGLDVVFVFDSTGSMTTSIRETTSRIHQLMSFLHYLVPEARLGLVTYRDLKQFDVEWQYTVRAESLTKDEKPLVKFLGSVDARGGGDLPEAVHEGLNAAMHMNWMQGSKKVIILFGDASPRPENGGLNRTYELCKSWHKETGGVVYAIDTSAERDSGSKLMPEFKEIARAGGGEATLLDNPRNLIGQLIVYTFGAEWKGDTEAVLNHYFGEEETVTPIVGD